MSTIDACLTETTEFYWSRGRSDALEIPLSDCKLPSNESFSKAVFVTVGIASRESADKEIQETQRALQRGKNLAEWIDQSNHGNSRYFVLNLGMIKDEKLAEDFFRNEFNILTTERPVILLKSLVDGDLNNVNGKQVSEKFRSIFSRIDATKTFSACEIYERESPWSLKKIEDFGCSSLVP